MARASSGGGVGSGSLRLSRGIGAAATDRSPAKVGEKKLLTRVCFGSRLGAGRMLCPGKALEM